MKVRADAKGLPLSLEFQGSIPEEVTTDPIRVRQSLVNLIGNAIKFTEVGICVSVAAQCFARVLSAMRPLREVANDGGNGAAARRL